jgi:hypothetical protein
MADGTAGTGEAREVLGLTLRGLHHICITSGNGALKLAVENLDTGDKFGRSLCAEDLPSLVPEELATDVESLDDFEYVLVAALKAEHAVTQKSTRTVANVAAGAVFHVPADPAEEPPAILAASKECPPDGGRALRFTIQVRVVRGLPGRPKVHTFELIVPVTSVATKDDAVSCIPPPLRHMYTFVLHFADPVLSS